METLSNIRLVPVINLCPSVFDEIIYPFQGKVSDEQKYQYWKEVLIKNGLPNLEPIQKGMHDVKVNDIDDQSLETLINYFLIDISEFRCDKDAIEKPDLSKGITPTSFGGGVILTSNDKIIMTPQCCVSLQDHVEWSRIHRSESFQHIWLGHPWIYYKTQGEDILFTRLIEKAFDGKTWRHYTQADNTMMMDSSQCIEKSKKEINDEDLKYRVNFEEMQQAIAGMQNELHVFQDRIEKIANRMQIVNPAHVADCFVNGNGEMLSYSELE